MDLGLALRTRRSIRVYRRDEVPRAVIKEILDTAVRAPSSFNSQPWEFVVASSKSLDAIRDHNEQMLARGEPPHPDFPAKRLEGVYRQRQLEVFAELCRLEGVDPHNKAAVACLRRRSYRFFEAPAAIIISFDGSLDAVRAHFDLGMVSQNICLGALAQNLGTCLCLEAVSYAEKIREVCAIPPEKKICVAIALGYPDTGHPANRLLSQREPVGNLTRWAGFENEEASEA
jgi:nitroreductase